MLRVDMTDSANPFVPPQARLADPHAPLEPRGLAPARKPIAVWAMQGLGGVAILGMGAELLMAVMSGPMRAEFIVPLAVFSVVWVVFAMCVALVIRDCQRRERRGRRLGLAVIGAMALFAVWCIFGDSMSLDNLRSAVASHTDRRRYLPWVLLAGSLAWGWRFGFSRAARTWFGLAGDGAAKA